jgi:3' terminal RNA ribose 2'-O-methyltransferase Hen1
VLLSLTSTARPATDLGFLLHKNPANTHSAELSFGNATVFYSEASEERCTACLLLEISPVELVRGARQLEDYVNDRPYVASSYMSVAMGRVFGTALAGNCAKRPELVAMKLPLTARLPVVRARGAELLTRIFEPLGYTVTASPIPLDETNLSPYFGLTLQTTATVHDVLSHLYVLLPVLDEEKHYYIGADEIAKLLRHGEGWLATHPERELIVKRYLRRDSSLVSQVLEQFDGETNTEKELERPITLHTQRLSIVADRLKELGAKSVIDLGCGEGKLLRRLLADRAFERIAGMDVSHGSLERAKARVNIERHRQRVQLFQGSLLYRDKRLEGYDGAALVEVIEHLDVPRLAAMERVVFEFARPRHVIVTTPNKEYNVLFPTLPQDRMRHNDHRFEWTRAEFAAWANPTAARFGYRVTIEPLGPVDETHGAPSQLAVFSL